jgi:hypothetical protein
MPNLPSVPPSSSEVADFIAKLSPDAAARTAPAGRGRLIFALDATASRAPTWDHACHLQGEMFEATAALGGLDVQLVYYRGYNECRASRWLATAADLHRIMRQVACEAGETQIERMLSHAIRETSTRKVGAMVFVGDALEESLDRLARLAGELGEKGVPLFMFYETPGDPLYGGAAARSGFEVLAHAGNGVCLDFDRSSPARLRQLLGGIAAYAMGGHPALRNYASRAGNASELLRLTVQLKP